MQGSGPASPWPMDILTMQLQRMSTSSIPSLPHDDYIVEQLQRMSTSSIPSLAPDDINEPANLPHHVPHHVPVLAAGGKFRPRIVISPCPSPRTNPPSPRVIPSPQCVHSVCPSTLYLI